MPLKHDRLERSLTLAKKSLELWEQELDNKGVAVEARKKNPRWRNLNSNCKQIESRMQSASDLATRGTVAPAEESSDEA